jgi:hypothetical protein
MNREDDRKLLRLTNQSVIDTNRSVIDTNSFHRRHIKWTIALSIAAIILSIIGLLMQLGIISTRQTPPLKVKILKDTNSITNQIKVSSSQDTLQIMRQK